MAQTLTAAGPAGGRLSRAAARVYVALREEFLTGQIPPGTMLHETEIAARFDVSKSPVRDALGALRVEGYVDVIPHRGYIASGISIRDFNELFHVRAVLEAETASLAAARATPEQIALLESLREDGMRADERTDLGEYVEANKRFHLAIADAAGSGLLYRLVDQLLDQSARAVALGLKGRPRSDTRVYREADRIIDAIKRRAPDDARRAMAEHIENTRRRFLALGDAREV